MDDFPPGFRMQSLAAIESFLRMLQAVIEIYGDLEAFTVYLAVLAANAGAVSRDAVLSARFGGEEPIPEEYLRPVSARAIALSTGLSRETTRRKLTQLIDDGHLIKDARGIRPPVTVMAQRDNMKFAKLLLEEFSRTAKRVTQIGAAAAKGE